MRVHGTALDTDGTLKRVGLDSPGLRLDEDWIMATKKTKKKRTKKRPDLKLAGAIANNGRPTWDVSKIWTKKLGKPFTPVSSYFLDNYHRLAYPITPTEFVVIVHLLKYKWDEEMPFPAIATLAKKMGRSEQAVRAAARSLEDKGYLVRHMTRGRPNRFDLKPLFEAVEKLYDDDQAAEAEESKTRRKRRTG